MILRMNCTARRRDTQEPKPQIGFAQKYEDPNILAPSTSMDSVFYILKVEQN